MQLKSLWLYTATPFINTVLDMGGFFALLQKLNFTLRTAGQATNAQIQTWNTPESVTDSFNKKSSQASLVPENNLGDEDVEKCIVPVRVHSDKIRPTFAGRNKDNEDSD